MAAEFTRWLQYTVGIHSGQLVRADSIGPEGGMGVSDWYTLSFGSRYALCVNIAVQVTGRLNP